MDGVARHWTYRVWAVRNADGSQSGSKENTSTETFDASTCGGGEF